ncbi:ArsR family transcriptional regulator [Streptomyces yerevanensis]|uniref:ArsR family transcriptional regulator n=1 Tax=Streptomyces yerevanensis TaxID=66378 RepID=UPI0014702218|nr:ArsR family transcriptional regulator [Streptomyces yerevanensis]
MARFGRALADPIRCRILLALREAPAHPADRLEISRTRLSNHLACLRDCGIVIASLAALVIAIELQVRVVEEPYLRQAHGAAYLDYATAAGRFIPAIGRLRSMAAQADS